MTVRAHWSAESVSPLHLASGRSLGGMVATLPYIPGSAIRGALAAAFLAERDVTSQGFRPLAEGTRFGNLYPAVRDIPAASAPLPLSSVTCSHMPGFAADGGHGVGDVLVPAEVALLAAEAASGAATTPESPPPSFDAERLVRCRHCADERQRLPVPGTIPWLGYCAWQDETPHLAPLRYDSSVERRASVRDWPPRQAITVRQTLPAGQQFSGEVTFPDPETAELAMRLLQTQDHQLWVGAGRSRGLGAVRVTNSEAPSPAADLIQRQQALTGVLEGRCRRASVSLPDGQTYVTLTLRSAALLPDAFGRWQRSIVAESLGQLTGLPAGVWQVRQVRVAHLPIEGWNAALGLPKPDVVAIAAGSCWLLRVQGVSLDELYAALHRLEDEGIGERRQEGYGMISVCDPLHWQVQELEGEQQA